MDGDGAYAIVAPGCHVVTIADNRAVEGKAGGHYVNDTKEAHYL